MEKIRWGVLGTADIARTQTIPAMKLATNCELYAVAGRSPEKAKDFRKEFGFQKAYGSYDELLADPAVEAVYISLPNHLHCEWAVRALKAKKHVLCEKPLAVSKAQAESMFQAAEENGVYLMEAFAYLHSPIISAIRAEAETIGGNPVSGIRLHHRTAAGYRYPPEKGNLRRSDVRPGLLFPEHGAVDDGKGSGLCTRIGSVFRQAHRPIYICPSDV